MTQQTFNPASLDIYYLMPLRWSLSYALTDKQWQDVRQRHKQLNPNWAQCPLCPKRCPATDLDERWKYDHGQHVKVFTGALFICRGCHWFKSLPHRISTWLKQSQGRLPKMTEPPHIISCLGFSQEQVDRLRESDLQKHRIETIQLRQLKHDKQRGKAVFLPSPIERLSSDQLSHLVRPDQIAVVPWRVDLSALARYGYSSTEIICFEERMYKFAAKRMGHDSA